MIRYRTILLILIFTNNACQAQVDKYRIIKAFDSIEYYSDSTIKCAYKIKRRKPNGYAIEFRENGDVLCIGKYKQSKKNGHWQYNGGMFKRYRKGQSNFMAVPGCGTGRRKTQADFQKLYYELIKYYE